MIQLQLINSVLKSRDASIITQNGLGEEYFSDYKDEYKYIREHMDAYGTVPDYATFLAKFPKFDVVDVNETNEYLLDAIADDRSARELASAFNKMRSLLMQNKIKEAQSVFNSAKDITSSAKRLHYVDIIHDTNDRYNAYVEKCNDYARAYVSTGFPELDQLIGGYDRHEEDATLVARTGIGKTWGLIKSAIAGAKAGLRVGFYSGEMSPNKIGYRADTLISHISNYSLTHGNAEAQVEYRKFLDGIGDNIKGNIFIITPEDLGGYATVDTLKAFIETAKLEMLCIDQHSLLEDKNRAKDPVTRASNISRDLKKLQVMTRIPIISACQQNRQSIAEGIDTTHIAGTDRIGGDSTTIIFFEQNNDMLSLIVAKSRDSVGNKRISYAFDYDKGIFSYIPTETDALGGDACEELRQSYESESTGESVF